MHKQRHHQREQKAASGPLVPMSLWDRHTISRRSVDPLVGPRNSSPAVQAVDSAERPEESGGHPPQATPTRAANTDASSSA